MAWGSVDVGWNWFDVCRCLLFHGVILGIKEIYGRKKQRDHQIYWCDRYSFLKRRVHPLWIFVSSLTRQLNLCSEILVSILRFVQHKPTHISKEFGIDRNNVFCELFAERNTFRFLPQYWVAFQANGTYSKSITLRKGSTNYLPATGDYEFRLNLSPIKYHSISLCYISLSC